MAVFLNGKADVLRNAHLQLVGLIGDLLQGHVRLRRLTYNLLISREVADAAVPIAQIEECFLCGDSFHLELTLALLELGDVV